MKLFIRVEAANLSLSIQQLRKKEKLEKYIRFVIDFSFLDHVWESIEFIPEWFSLIDVNVWKFCRASPFQGIKITAPSQTHLFIIDLSII